jgi:hypothetical protein
VPLAFVLAALSLALSAQLAGATHPRPKAATPLRASLVPAYQSCAAPNRTHGPPLASPSCNPPVPASRFLTIGTPDANGAAANFQGFIQVSVLTSPPPQSDSQVVMTARVSDVRCRAGTSTCGNANARGGPDYTGELQMDATLRVTDHYNATAPGGGSDAATVVDIPFPAPLVCANTSDTSVGGLCNLTTTATEPGIPNQDWYSGKRVIVEITQIHVFDGGPDGWSGSTPNDLFAVQGVFIP